MLEESVLKAFKEIAQDIILLWQKALDTDVGINDKIGYNTLSDSSLKEETETDLSFPNILFKYNEYGDFIEQGRKPHATKVPIEALRQWARKKNIPTDNKVLFSIREAIYRDGISPRPIFTLFSDLLDKEWDETYAEYLYLTITEHLEKYFKD